MRPLLKNPVPDLTIENRMYIIAEHYRMILAQMEALKESPDASPIQVMAMELAITDVIKQIKLYDTPAAN